MKRAIVSRLLASIIVVWLVLTATFVVHHVVPSDPARALAGPQARPVDVERLRQQLGLDRPLWFQYRAYFKRLVHVAGGDDKEHRSCTPLGPLHVDLGTSFQRHKPVAALLAERLPRTLLLGACAIGVQIILGTAAGLIAALRKGKAADHGTIALTLIGVSAPTFLTGLLLQYWFAHRLRLLPFDGYGTTPWEHARSLVLPALTLGLFGASFYARFVRDEMVTILQQDYIRTAMAKGVSRTRVVLVHGLRNALMPLVTIVGMDLGAMMGGAIVTEKLFRWPGIGALSVDAVLARDGPVVMGVVLLSAVAIVLANVLVDLTYAALDPRIRRPA